VLVVGAGVSGMTSAIRLAESGYRVEIISDTPPLETTSCAAGALWGPYLSTDKRMLPWGEHARQEFSRLASDQVSGVRCLLGLEAARVPAPVPQWAPSLPGYRIATRDELRGFSNGWWYEAPLIDMPVYLRYLLQRLDAHGVPITIDTVTRFDQQLAAGRTIVNCTGFGARAIIGDDSLTPVRGQLVVVRNPGIDHFFAEHDESPAPVYLLPHGDLLVLGGSILEGVDDTRADPTTAAAIQERCAQVEPSIRGLEPVDHRVGIRPGRPEIRLEHEYTADGVHLVHNYGHGGAGVTLSWGCAEAVVALANG